MTHRGSTSRMAGRLLLALARTIFEEPVLSTIVCPALADLQQEVHEAGGSPIRQIAARVRGYVAFWRLVAVCVVALPATDVRRSPMMTIHPVRAGGRPLVVLSLFLFAAIWPVFGWFSVAAVSLGVALAVGLRLWNSSRLGARATADPLLILCASALLAALWSMFGWFIAATIVAGLLMAVALRRWNTRHPSTVVASVSVNPDARINMSSIPVAGDIGGLFFVIGAVTIVLLGLPDVRWFVVASTIVAGVLALGLFTWRSKQAEPRFLSVMGR